LIALSAALHGSAAPLTEEELGKQALAEEFSQSAIRAVAGKQPTLALVRQSAALLQAACDECAYEPRYPRLLVEACLQLGDADGATAALMRYRAIQLPEVQNDQFAQVQLIDLFLRKQQTLDNKLSYLKSILGIAAIPDPVKSHVAWVASNLLAQKFDQQGSDQMLARALALNPVSPEALQSQYEKAQSQGTPQQRAAALVALLRSNPAQPLVMGTLADELASTGQPDLAVTWYRRSFAIGQTLGLGLDPGRYLNFAAALYAMDQPQQAVDAANLLLSSEPSNIGAATIAFLAARSAAKLSPPAPAPLVGIAVDPVEHARAAALAALTAQLGILHSQLHGVTGAAVTQPSSTQPVDLVGDIANDAPQLRDIQSKPDADQSLQNISSNYSAALSDLVFYYSYFNPETDTARRLLDSLKLLRASDDPEVTRLEGFIYLADHKLDEARQKFSAVAKSDALAQMGLILMQPPGTDVAADAAKLVSDHPAGLIGAILLDALKDKGGKPVVSADGQAVASEVAAFPLKLLDLLDRAHSAEFYNLVAEPLRVSAAFDEPQLVRVTLKNIGEYDLSVGADAAIRPDLWFDAVVQGGANAYFAGTAYDRIAGPLVLKAHQLDKPGTDQVVRVDAGKLQDYLVGRPTPSLSMLFSVFTNPIGQQAGVAPGPGGYRKQFNTPMERTAAPISAPTEVAKLVDLAMNGRPDQKIYTLELLRSYVFALRKHLAASAAAAGPAGAPPNSPAPDAAAPSPSAPADAAGAATGDAGALAPPPGVAAAAPPHEAPLDPATAQRIAETVQTFTQTIRAGLRDATPSVRYWAQVKVAQISDAQTRLASALEMAHGKDWELRMCALLVASELPLADRRAVAQLLKDDPNEPVRKLADVTFAALAALPATAPAETTPAATSPDPTPPAPAPGASPSPVSAPAPDVPSPGQ
jgi:hypothetical protein